MQLLGSLTVQVADQMIRPRERTKCLLHAHPDVLFLTLSAGRKMKRGKLARL